MKERIKQIIDKSVEMTIDEILKIFERCADMRFLNGNDAKPNLKKWISAYRTKDLLYSRELRYRIARQIPFKFMKGGNERNDKT